MSRSESYHCDVCGKLKSHTEVWWMAWVDCVDGEKPGQEQPFFKLTRWNSHQAHSEGVMHLCGARCSETLIDRWISEQREVSDARHGPERVTPVSIMRRKV